MFKGCCSLEKLNLSNFNLSNVKNLSHIFSGCELLEALDIYNFITNQVNKMSYIFSVCFSLIKSDISNLILIILLIWKEYFVPLIYYLNKLPKILL